jgi:hypothetical protein
MGEQKDEDAVRYLNQRFPIWRFLREKEVWEEILNSPTIYLSFIILLFGSIGFIAILPSLSESGTSILIPNLIAFATLLMLTAYIGASSVFSILKAQQLRKHLEIIQRVQEDQE